MRVAALVQQPNHVCSRYRIEAFAPYLRAWGLNLDLVPLGKGVRPRIAALLAASRADVVILQRKLLPFWQLAALRRAARRLIYDFDDALFVRDTFHRKPPTSWDRQLKFWAIVYASDAVLAGNRYLAERAAAYVGTQPVHVLPTCVTPSGFRMAYHQREGELARLVWIGQRATSQYLALPAAQWSALKDRLPAVELRLICDVAVTLPGIRTVLRQWSQATEAAELADGDIGVSWLPDDSWSRGKCGLKVLQYMAAGLPVVANPVGCTPEMVIHGETGFLASTPQQWAEAICRLAADPALRRRMGEAGRRRVEERYSTQRWGPRFAEIVAGVAGKTTVDAHHPHAAPTALDFRQEAARSESMATA